MKTLLTNPHFLSDYESLKGVKLNPARHSARNAYEHCEMVSARIIQMAAQNGCSPEETQLLQNLAFAHDIGKIAGTADPAKSVELLPRYGIADDDFIELVKYHDINLPWYMAQQRGQPPSDKAWRKLASKVNVRLLCLFMIADRVDCPGGWLTNRPLVWFMEEAKNRKLLDRELILDDGPTVPATGKPVVEVSAGAALLRGLPAEPELLVIRVRSSGYELPKGHLEWDETPKGAAARELHEETGLLSGPDAAEHLGTLEYFFDKDGVTVHKQVHYFLFAAVEPDSLIFGKKPVRTKELHWIKRADVATLPLVNEDLRPIMLKAFETFAARQ